MRISTYIIAAQKCLTAARVGLIVLQAETE